MHFRLIYPRPYYTNDSLFSHSRIIDYFFATADRLLGGGIYQRGKRQFLVPPLNLMLLAAMMPPDISVDIIDERAQPIDFDQKVDVVGITCMTADAPRAYEIADIYRKRGVQVVLGGIHPTVLPNEAAEHAHAVVIGEAEGLIETLVRDARQHRLQRFYQNSTFHDLKGLPFPRKDLLDDRHYITRNVIQTTRGCPHRCTFCSISTTAGLDFRRRPINEIVAEIEASDGRFFGFVDDNVNGHPTYALELFRALAPLNIHWYGDATVFIAEKEENLRLLAASGCKILLIGFESLSQPVLNALNKRFNKSARFQDMIKRIHDHGIGIVGSFILGLDGEGPEQAEAIVEFAEKASLDLATASVLTPYPGTALFKQLEADGRLLTKDWSQYDTTRGRVVFEPLNLTIDQLQAEYFRLYNRLYSLPSITRRLAGSRCYPSFFIPYNFRQRKKVRTARRLFEQDQEQRIPEALGH